MQGQNGTITVRDEKRKQRAIRKSLEYHLVKYCAPTLADLKTAGLFSLACEDQEALKEEVLLLDRVLRSKGLRLALLRAGEKKALIYCYRPKRLQEDLASEKACRMLRALGYCPGNSACMLRALARKLRCDAEFPHEIGLFLGYPCEDVEGFILHKGKGCKCCADWKVYADEEGCRRLFSQFRQCRVNLLRRFCDGASIEELAALS